jgi:hypothetical protein
MASRFLAPRLLAATLALSAAAATSSTAFADPSAADKETARGLMNDGRAARDKGDNKGALKAFAAADSLMHVPTTGLELAKAQVAVGQLVEARDTALRVTRIPAKDGEPAPFKAARDAAASLNDELGGRIPSLTLTLKNVPDGVTPDVTIDGAEVPAEVLGHPRKLNPGHHAIEAKAGTATGKQEVDIAEKETKEVTIELPAQEAAPPAPPPDESKPAEQPAESSRGNKVMIWGGFGLAAVGVVAGSVTGIMALSKASSIKGSPACSGSTCNTSVDGDLSSGKTMATVSTISFIAAGVGATIGVIGLFVGGGGDAAAAPADKPAEAPPADATSLRLHVVPWIGLGSAGLNGTF